MATAVLGNNLSKAYDSRGQRIQALTDASLEVYPGEMVALIGRTGAGQSVLLYLLGGLHRPDSGQVSIEDQDITGLEDQDLARLRASKAGYILQSADLLPNQNLLANVAVPLWGTAVAREEIPRVARNALRLVGLENRMQLMPSQLSAKQRQIAAVARAVVNDPAVIFAEEPARGLDGTGREEIMGLLQRLNNSGKTIVIATSESGLGAYCRRVVKIADGRVAEDSLVEQRRVVALSRRTGRLESEIKEDENACPRCNYSNAKGEANCQRCNTTLGGRRRAGRAGGRRRMSEAALQDLVAELMTVPFLQRLGSMVLDKVALDLDPQDHPKGSRITNRGDPADFFYLIRSGEVQMVLEGEDGSIAPIANFGPKEGFGEAEILTNRRQCSFSIFAATDVALWCLSRKAFQTLLDDHPSMARYFKELLEQRFKMFQDGVHSSVVGQGPEGGDDGPGLPEPPAPPVQEMARPPVGASRAPVRAPAIRTGDRVVPLEKILGGGLSIKSLTMAVGVKDGGKSVLCQHLTYGALQEGHGVAYFASDHTGESLVKQMGSLGLEVSSFLQDNKLMVYTTSQPDGNDGTERTLESLAVEIEGVPEQYGVIFVDDITELATRSPEMGVIRFFAFIRSLCQGGKTCIIAARSHAFDEPLLNRLETLCDAHLFLGMDQVGAKVSNVLAVPKINNVKQQVANRISFEVDRGSGMRILPFRQARI